MKKYVVSLGYGGTTIDQNFIVIEELEVNDQSLAEHIFDHIDQNIEKWSSQYDSELLLNLDTLDQDDLLDYKYNKYRDGKVVGTKK